MYRTYEYVALRAQGARVRVYLEKITQLHRPNHVNLRLNINRHAYTVYYDLVDLCYCSKVLIMNWFY